MLFTCLEEGDRMKNVSWPPLAFAAAARLAKQELQQMVSVESLELVWEQAVQRKTGPSAL